MKKPGLTDAYGLKSADDSRKLYADWAETYDDGFIAAQSYVLPAEVARAFVEAGGVGPVLDVGAGTGAVAEELKRFDRGPVDGFDLSTEMLEVARAKGHYRTLFEADVLAPLKPPHRDHKGIVSAGTFTLGHVGPEGLDSLLDFAGPGTLFAISINAKHYQSAGFEAKFAGLSGQVQSLTLREVPIYGANADAEHRDDRAFVALFKKA